METKHCSYCNVDHPLTSEFWGRLEYSMYPQCKKKLNKQVNNYYHRNREKVIRANARYAKSRREIDPNYNLTIILRQRLGKAIKGGYKAGSAVRDLGCSIEEFRVYIESKFQPGMNWNNLTRNGWHIDHIKPLSSFNLEDPEQFKQATHYTNLQPLWAEDNLRKSNKALLP